MNRIQDTFEGFLQGREERLNIPNEASKDTKMNLKIYMTNNPNNVYNCLAMCRNVEVQMTIAILILNVCNKFEIVKYKIAGDHSSGLSSILKNNKNSLLRFLISFNNNITTSNYTGSIQDRNRFDNGIVGVEFEKAELPNKKIVNGFIFIGENSLRLQESNEVVIIFFKSIKDIRIDGIDLKIEATENRNILIKLKYDQDLTRFKDKIERLLHTFESEDSLILELSEQMNTPTRRSIDGNRKQEIKGNEGTGLINNVKDKVEINNAKDKMEIDNQEIKGNESTGLINNVKLKDKMEIDKSPLKLRNTIKTQADELQTLNSVNNELQTLNLVNTSEDCKSTVNSKNGNEIAKKRKSSNKVVSFSQEKTFLMNKSILNASSCSEDQQSNISLSDIVIHPSSEDCLIQSMEDSLIQSSEDCLIQSMKDSLIHPSIGDVTISDYSIDLSITEDKKNKKIKKKKRLSLKSFIPSKKFKNGHKSDKRRKKRGNCKRKEKSFKFFKKVKVFDKLDNKIDDIYKDKLKLAKFMYEKMKKEAFDFKRSLQKISSKKIVRLKSK